MRSAVYVDLVAAPWEHEPRDPFTGKWISSLSSPVRLSDVETPGDDQYPQVSSADDIAPKVTMDTPGGKQVLEYTDAWAGEINPRLRRGDGGSSSEVESMDLAFDYSTKNTTLYRMAPPEAFGKEHIWQVVVDKELIGKVVTAKGYTSTSFDPESPVVRSRNLVLKLHVPKGTPVANGASVSVHEDEDEVILGRDLDFKITGIRKFHGDTFAESIQTVVDIDVIGGGDRHYGNTAKKKAYAKRQALIQQTKDFFALSNVRHESKPPKASVFDKAPVGTTFTAEKPFERVYTKKRFGWISNSLSSTLTGKQLVMLNGGGGTFTWHAYKGGTA